MCYLYLGVLSPTRKFNVPSKKVPYFTGRHDLLELLSERFPITEDILCEPRVVSIWGMGGVGKTQLVLQYISMYTENYFHIFWIDATNDGTLIKSFETIAAGVNLTGEWCLEDPINPEYKGNAIKSVKNWLETPESRHWLLVFDNVGDKEISSLVRKQIPRSGRGDIILTSRLRYLAPQNAIEVKEMEEMEALDLFLTRVNCGRQPQDVGMVNDCVTARNIIKSLGFLPLALEFVGTYIYHNSITLERYLCLYREILEHELSSGYEPDVPSYDEAILTTWDISFKAVKRESPHAAELLLFMGCLDQAGISEELFRQASETQESRPERHRIPATEGEEGEAVKLLEEIMATSREGEWRMLRFTEAMGILMSHSLLRKVHPNSYALHPLVHRWSRKHSLMGRESWRLQLVLFCVGNAARVQGNTSGFLTELTLHLDHLRRESQEWKHVNEEYHIQITPLFVKVYTCQMRLREAESLGLQVRAAKKKILGEEHPGTLESIDELALIYLSQDRCREAEHLYLEVLAARSRILGEEYPETLKSVGNLALTYHYQGRLREAEYLYAQVVVARRKILGEDHPETLESANKLALVYGHQGRCKEAENLFVQVVAARKRILGEEHPETWESINSLAWVYHSQGL